MGQVAPQDHVRDSQRLHADARRHALPALYKAAAEGMPTLANKGHIGAGIGIRVPVRRPKGQSVQALHADTRATNALIRNVRVLSERTAAELKQRWRILQHVSVSPSRIGDITRAALVLNRHWKRSPLRRRH
ncbi:transposase family protein [Streptomyces sp. NPDC088178]|uniref:transposase family protein n=1 Tax=Streptomyces sp. NPDC088178 TaxID=3365836 RepID=UPI00381B7541